MHRPWRFLEDGKQAGRQRPQRRFFHFIKELAHLLAGGAVDARVGHVLLPISQEKILRG